MRNLTSSTRHPASQSIIRAKLAGGAVPAAAINSERGNFAIAAVVPEMRDWHG